MKNLVLFLFSFLILVSACKKKDTTSTPPVTTSPYYFKGTLDGANYNYTQNQPEYMFMYTNEAGGYQVANASLWPSIGLRLSWPADDTVKESDIMGLIGKTLYFSDTAITPELTYDKVAAGTGSWTSIDTSNTSYYVKITNVTFLKKDTTIGYYLRTYVITGTCSALMTDLTKTSVFSGGYFNFIISRRDL